MPPPRDSFALALSALRRRLRQAVDAPGAAIPINLIAQELRLSATPVREALSRLAGEELVEKQGHAYTRPRLDSPSLAELYGLRWLYLAHALSSPAVKTSGRLPERPPIMFSAVLAENHAHPGEVVEALLLEIVLAADDLMLAQAYRRAAERLAPMMLVEARLFGDATAEALELVRANDTAPGGLRQAVRTYHRRRVAAAPMLARLADGPKYQPDIV